MYGSQSLAGQVPSADVSINGSAQSVRQAAESLAARVASILANIEGSGLKGSPENAPPSGTIINALGAANEQLHKTHEMLSVLERKLFG